MEESTLGSELQMVDGFPNLNGTISSFFPLIRPFVKLSIHYHLPRERRGEAALELQVDAA